VASAGGNRRQVFLLNQRHLSRAVVAAGETISIETDAATNLYLCQFDYRRRAFGPNAKPLDASPLRQGIEQLL
jgi:hypothetical protein